MLLGIAGNVLKQNAIAPPPKDPSMATEEEAGRAGRNFIRGALLGVGATMLGVLLFGAPEVLAGPLGLKLPAQLTEPGFIVSLGGGGHLQSDAASNGLLAVALLLGAQPSRVCERAG
jgi:hypothetical protein